MSELSKAVSVLTNLIVYGKFASSVEINVEKDMLNVKSLAPKFDFGTGIATLMDIAPISKEDDRQKLANSRVYFFSHILNIFSGMFPLFFYLYWTGYISFPQFASERFVSLTGCVGSNVREKKQISSLQKGSWIDLQHWKSHHAKQFFLYQCNE